MAGDVRSLVAHLFRRAGFGARPVELDHYTGVGYARAVEDLVSGAPIMGGRQSFDETFDPINRPVGNLRSRTPVLPALNDIQTAWLHRMVTTSAPLVERMTLFLHDHWATAFRPGDNIDTPELTAQNDLFRANALGNWRTLCHSMIEDVALSCWLDNNHNYKARPNENLAREYMELFTLGSGNYTEQDIREAARALTGYELGYSLNPTGPRNVMVFKASAHDNTNKTILGMGPANFMPHDFVDIALMQDAAPLFLARKLIETFVTPTPSSTFIGYIASVLRSGWQLREALRAIFTSDEFIATSARSTIVKSPAEFVAGALRALDRNSTDDIQLGVGWMGAAGQKLYDPPNVGGWPVNEGWMGAGGILARYNAGVTLGDRHISQGPLLPTQRRLRATTPDGWAEIFGITELAPETRAAMEGYMRDGNKNDTKAMDAAMITLIVSSPDYSLA